MTSTSLLFTLVTFGQSICKLDTKKKTYLLVTAHKKKFLRKKQIVVVEIKLIFKYTKGTTRE